jgi:hypothetical protein
MHAENNRHALAIFQDCHTMMDGVILSISSVRFASDTEKWPSPWFFMEFAVKDSDTPSELNLL